GMVCVVGRMRDLILQLSKSSIYSTKPNISCMSFFYCWVCSKFMYFLIKCSLCLIALVINDYAS
ncbi:hypothetical protein F0330_25025, partial [Klebsiella pneumoniae]